MSLEEIKEALYELMLDVDGVEVGKIETREDLEQKIELTKKTVWSIWESIKVEEN